MARRPFLPNTEYYILYAKYTQWPSDAFRVVANGNRQMLDLPTKGKILQSVPRCANESWASS